MTGRLKECKKREGEIEVNKRQKKVHLELMTMNHKENKYHILFFFFFCISHVVLSYRREA